MRQIEARAIRKLQNPIRARMFEGFLGEREDDLSTQLYLVKERDSYTLEQRDLIFKSPVDNFELSIRTRNILEHFGIKTIGELCNVTERDLLSQRNCGETAINEIKTTLLRPYGLNLKEEKTEKEN